jgi:hypothetical protein
MVMVVEKPVLLYESRAERRRHMRRFLWNTLASMGGVGAYALFRTWQSNPQLPPNLVQVGITFAVGVFAIFGVRGLFALSRGFRLKSETVRFYDRGLRWTTTKAEYKYSWKQLVNLHEGYRQYRIGGRLIGQTGAASFTMADGTTLKLKPPHGDLKKAIDKIRPVITDLLSSRMAAALRDGQKLQVHPRITMVTKGIKAGNEAIRWQDVDVTAKNGRLTISKRGKGGRFTPVVRVPTRSVDNLDGFLDLATGVIQAHQPDRFGVETQVGKVYYEEAKSRR